MAVPGVDILLQVGVSTEESTRVLNSWANDTAQRLEDVFGIKMNPNQVLKSLSAIEMQADKTTKEINKLVAVLSLTSGRTITVEAPFYKADDGKYYADDSKIINQTSSVVKENRNYLRTLDSLLKKRKELDKLQTTGTGTEAEIKRITVLENQTERLNHAVLARQKILSQTDTYESRSTLQKGREKIADYESYQPLLQDKKDRADAKAAETQKNKELREYEAREKEILKNKQIAWRLEEQANTNRFKNSESSRRAQAQANEKVAELINLNKQARAGAIGDEQHLKNMKGLTSEYNKNAEKTHNIIRAQYAQNKNFFTDMMAGWKDATARIINYTVIYRSLWAGIKGVQAGIQAIAQLNKQFTDIQMVTGSTNEQIKEMSKNYADLANQLGVTTTSIAEGATEWL